MQFILKEKEKSVLVTEKYSDFISSLHIQLVHLHSANSCQGHILFFYVQQRVVTDYNFVCSAKLLQTYTIFICSANSYCRIYFYIFLQIAIAKRFPFFEILANNTVLLEIFTATSFN